MDGGREEILAALTSVAAEDEPGCWLVDALGTRYPARAGSCDVVVGNSSSGVIEAAAVGIPAVDVGLRQQGRLRSDNVYWSDEGADAVRAALRHVLQDDFRERAARAVSVYGDGTAARRIVDVVLADPPARAKRFVDGADHASKKDRTAAIDPLLVARRSARWRTAATRPGRTGSSPTAPPSRARRANGGCACSGRHSARAPTPSRVEVVEQPVAAAAGRLRHEHRVEPVRRVEARRPAAASIERQVRRTPRRSARDAALGGDELVEPLELGEPERGGEVGEPVVVADLVVQVADVRHLGLGRQVPGPARRGRRRR